MTTYEWICLIGVLLGGFWVLTSKLSAIEKALVGKVGFKECDARRDKCPCVQEVERLKKRMETK